MQKFREFKLTITYNLAGSVREMILKRDPEEEVLDFIVIDNAFISKAIKPSKESILLEFIENILWTSFQNWRDGFETHDWEELLIDYEVDFSELKQKFKNASIEESDYTSELEDLVGVKVLDKISLEVFTFLFGDRYFLQQFHLIIAEIVKTLKVIDFPTMLELDGKVKRCKYWPGWVNRAIFYRDKGRCAICTNDLSGLLSTGIEDHIDHIVPLNIGGINDASNLQLLCRICNQDKGGTLITTSHKYPLYW